MFRNLLGVQPIGYLKGLSVTMQMISPNAPIISLNALMMSLNAPMEHGHKPVLDHL